MEFIKNKKAQQFRQRINVIVGIIITIVVLFSLFQTLVPEAQSAGNQLSDATRCSDAGGFLNATQALCLNGSNQEDTTVVAFSAIPIASIFSGTGVVILLLMVFLLLLILGMVLPRRR